MLSILTKIQADTILGKIQQKLKIKNASLKLKTHKSSILLGLWDLSEAAIR